MSYKTHSYSPYFCYIYNIWNWMLKDWPEFSYNAKTLETLEYQFSEKSGTVFGVLKHLQKASKDDFPDMENYQDLDKDKLSFIIVQR